MNMPDKWLRRRAPDNYLKAMKRRAGKHIRHHDNVLTVAHIADEAGIDTLPPGALVGGVAGCGRLLKRRRVGHPHGHGKKPVVGKYLVPLRALSIEPAPDQNDRLMRKGNFGCHPLQLWRLARWDSGFLRVVVSSG